MPRRREFRPQVEGTLESRIAPTTYVIRVVNRTSERVALFYEDRGVPKAKQFVAPGQTVRYTYTVKANAPLHVEGVASHRQGVRGINSGRDYFVANSGATNLRIGDGLG